MKFTLILLLITVAPTFGLRRSIEKYRSQYEVKPVCNYGPVKHESGRVKTDWTRSVIKNLGIKVLKDPRNNWWDNSGNYARDCREGAMFVITILTGFTLVIKEIISFVHMDQKLVVNNRLKVMSSVITLNLQ